MSDPNGVPFTVAPVPSEDPKRREDKDKDKDGKDGGINGTTDTSLVDGKATKVTKDGEEEELVSGSAPA